MAAHVSVRLDRGLAKALRDYQKRSGKTQSQAVRDLLRYALGNTPSEAGYAEGQMAGYRDVHERLAGRE